MRCIINQLVILVCLNQHSKKAEDAMIWRSPIGTRNGAPIILNDFILIGSNNYIDLKNEKDAATLLCYSKKNGALLSKLQFDRIPNRNLDMPSSAINGGLICDNSKMYFVSNQSKVVCAQVDKKGELKIVWNDDLAIKGVKKYTFDDYFNLLPGIALSGRNLIINTSHHPRNTSDHAPILINYDADTGIEKWKINTNTPTRTSSFAAPLIHKYKDREIVIAATSAHTIDIFDIKDGAKIGATVNVRNLLKEYQSKKHIIFDDILILHILKWGKRIVVNCSPLADSNSGAVPILIVDIDDICNNHPNPVLVPLDEYGNSFSIPTIIENYLYYYTSNSMALVIDMSKAKIIQSIDYKSARNKLSSIIIQGNKAAVPVGDSLYIYEIDKHGCLKQIETIEFGELIENNPLFLEDQLIVSTDKNIWSIKISK